ncbi:MULTISPECIES: mechanosensitive ion channel family protein [Chitinophagaceae]
MKHFSFLHKYNIIAILLLFIAYNTRGQEHSSKKDSIKIENISKKADTTQEIKALKSAISADTIIPFVANKLEKFSMQIHRSNRILKNIVNLTDLVTTTDSMNTSLDKMQKRMARPGYKMNLQSANTSLILLGESQEKTEDQLNNLSQLYNDLTQNNKNIKSILHDPIFQLNGIPDSNLVSQLNDLRDESKTLDSTETINIARINYMRSKLATLDLRFKDFLSDLHYLQESRSTLIMEKDEPALWNIKNNSYTQSQGLLSNIQKANGVSLKIVQIYMAEKGGIIILGLLILTATFTISYNCKKKLKGNESTAPITMQPLTYFSQNTFICSLFAALCYFPFFFANPPMSLLNLLQGIQCLLLIVLLKPILHRQGFIVWLILTVVCVLFCLDNQLLESTSGERWLLLVLQLTLIGTLMYIVMHRSGFTDVFHTTTLNRVILFVALTFTFFSLTSNLTGRVTLSKILGFTAIQVVILMMIYRIFAKIALEFMYMYSEANSNSRLSAFINYSELRTRYNRWLSIVGSIAFVIGLMHSLYLYSWLLSIIDILLNKHHKIGAFDFTLYSIFIFIVIIWISGIISSFVRFVLGSENFSPAGKRNKIGSMTLLIRLAIWILGFLIAIAAAGIPIDKITIILSALGVGIGFGLQNIANNLVSGIILAFERPIQVGDSIDIGSTSGTVSEIGVRSSKLKLSGGADVIIPNGDLLSEKITNWTLTNRTKQESFPIRIAYGEDLYRVQKMISEEIEQSDLILHEPPISVSVTEFGSNTILMKAYFWVRDVDNSLGIRSKLMYRVYDRLMKEHIQLPKDNGMVENN